MSPVVAGIIGTWRGGDGGDDLGVIDALQVDRGDAEFGMAELALDGVEGHALVGELDGVGVVWRS